jgi:membrane-associated phospholipid phosphatase
LRASNLRLGLAGACLFEATRVAARSGRISPLEEAIFRRSNGADDRLRLPVRAVMQAGTFATVPALAALLAARGSKRAAAEVAIGGTAAWLLAKAVKPLAGRPRPGLVLPEVRTREKIAGDLGWVSGHTAVATTLATIISPMVPPAGRPVLGLVVATTAFGRMYVGAHLPLDLVGGFALGVTIAATVRSFATLRIRADVPNGREHRSSDVPGRDVNRAVRAS